MRKGVFFFKRKIWLVAILLCALLLMCGCNTNNSKKYISRADKFLEEGEYAMALEYYSKAIDEGTSNNKAVALKQILDCYLTGKEHYNSGEYEKAYDALNKLTYDYTDYPINDDMDALIDDVDEKISNVNNIDKKLQALKKYINEGERANAQKLINELEKASLSKAQQDTFDYLCYKYESGNGKDDDVIIVDEGLDDANDIIIDDTPTGEVPKNEDKPVDNAPKPSTPTTPKPQNPTPTEPVDNLYRVRISWNDPSSQIGAFALYDNAVKLAKSNPGYKVFDSKGNVVYS